MDRSFLAIPSYVRPAIDMHAHPTDDRAKTEAMLDCARQVGITRIILSGVGYFPYVRELLHEDQHPSLARVVGNNEEVYALARQHPGFAYGYVYVNPNLPETLSILEDGLRRPGVAGIKLWASCRDEQGRLDPVYPVLEFAEDRQVPVLIHCLYRTGGQLPGELSPTDLVHLAQRYPRAPLIMAHMGGTWQHSMRVVQPYPNVFVDISGSRAFLGCVDLAVRVLGADRVLFGSDAWCRICAGQLAKVVAAGIDVADKRRILWDNSARLFFGEGRE